MNKTRITEQLLRAIWACENAESLLEDPFLTDNQEQVRRNIRQAADAFSGSWIGYHANVYYLNLQTPQPGDHFSAEWGLMSDGLVGRASPNWREYPRESIRQALRADVGEGYEERLTAVSRQAAEVLQEHLHSIKIIVELLLEAAETATLRETYERLTRIRPKITVMMLVEAMRPGGQLMTRDATAMSQGIITPVHCLVQAEQAVLLHPFEALKELTECCKQAQHYMELNDLLQRPETGNGNRVFLGHGRSAVWRELKDFLQDRLHLEWEEFNRTPTAGVATSDRLREMLGNSSFALLVMTAEDEHADRTLHARENVVHEVGLFQGKLGFRRAIVVLESGCAEFSNITGLSQIRFPAGNIAACFEELRRVLEREGII